jgi:prolyl-tRNA editing enzyme YbaK/EbsC (Cys-tRNA(Pro) deacylase)
VAHTEPSPVLIDETFARFDEVWAAAGTPLTVYHASPAELQRITQGTVADVAR